MENKSKPSNSTINPCFSVMIDLQESNRIKNKSSIDNDLSSEYSFHLAPRKINYWIKDDSVNNCYSCNEEFNLFKRKHHCRACGRIFCFYCCNNFIKLPIDIENFPHKPNNPGIKNILKDWVNWGKDDSNRVCNRCNKKYKQGEKIWLYINVLRIINLNIKFLKKISLLNKSFNKAANYCISNFRDIQYYLPKQSLSQHEKNMLWVNKHFIAGHSKWIVQLIKSVDWGDLEKVNVVLEILTSKKNTNCLQMMCCRQCQKKISASDSIELLYINNLPLKKYLIHCISLIENNELLCYINVIINSIKYNTENDIITNFIIQKSLSDINIRFKIYWALCLKSKDKIIGEHYKNIKKKLLSSVKEKLGDDHVMNLINSNKIIKVIKKINPNEEYKQNVVNILNKYDLFSNNILNPFNPSDYFTSIDIENIQIKKSATNPIVINFSGNKDTKILLKNEDIRKDQIVTDIIRLMDIILKRDMNLDLNIITYNVIPIDHESGIIEIVPESKTLYEIKHQMNMTLQNYILENNKNKTIDEVRQRFVKSSAAYCVITYLLGIGDRHLENIMVTKDGNLFHIDFGFILGEDPKKSIAPSMRITDDMVETLGGENSIYYSEFQKLCNLIYNCLRRYYNLFMNMLLLLQESYPPIINDSVNFNYDQLKNEIINRFLPGQVSKEAELHLINEINSSKSGGYKSTLIDTLHYYSKEGISKLLW